MSRRQRQNIINAVTAGIGILLIISVVWLTRNEFIFKKYTSKKHGFIIKYPAGWTVQEDTAGAAVVISSPKENDLDLFRENVNVVVQDISANPLSLKEYSELAIKQMEAVFKNNFVIMDSKPFMLAGLDGYQLDFLGKGPDAEYHYISNWTLDGLIAYQVTFTSSTAQYEKYLPKARRMFGSFRLQQ